MLKPLIYRLGSHPRRSLRAFLTGVALFAAGLGLLYLDQRQPGWLANTGIVFIALGLLTAAVGYVGIFANRFAQVLDRAEQVRNRNR